MPKQSTFVLALTVVAGLAVVALAGQDPRAVIGNVFLQDVSPGTVQNGNFSVKGTGVIGKVRVGTTVAGGSLIRAEDASTVGGAYFRSKGTGVYAANTSATGLGIGGSFASSSTGGRGVYGDALAGTGATRGGLFRSMSTIGVGAYGLAQSPSGETFGLVGESKSNEGTGVKGIAYGDNSNITYGVEGFSQSGFGAAVIGRNQATSGSGYGVVGDGLIGVMGSGTTFGIQGNSLSNGNARGVTGYASSPGGSTAYGVFGTAAGAGTKWGLYSDSNLAVVGTKSFEIDHPLDPEGKTLRHYCAEGDQPRLVYQGEAKLDGSGRATVRLADYVEAIGKDFTYQLTPIGSAMPGLHVAKRFASGTFALGGGTPGGSVSWTLSATRNDRWVQQYGAPVEVPKTGQAAGKYLRPDLYGQHPSRGVFFDPHQKR